MASAPPPLPDFRALVALSPWVAERPWLAEEAAIWQRELPAVRARLEAAGVPTLVHYATPLHRQPVFASSDRAPCPGADRLAREVVSLPLHAMLTRAEVERVEDALGAGCSAARS